MGNTLCGGGGGDRYKAGVGQKRDSGATPAVGVEGGPRELPSCHGEDAVVALCGAGEDTRTACMKAACSSC